jgi:hypothetical protein
MYILYFAKETLRKKATRRTKALEKEPKIKKGSQTMPRKPSKMPVRSRKKASAM